MLTITTGGVHKLTQSEGVTNYLLYRDWNTYCMVWATLYRPYFSLKAFLHLAGKDSNSSLGPCFFFPHHLNLNLWWRTGNSISLFFLSPCYVGEGFRLELPILLSRIAFNFFLPYLILYNCKAAEKDLSIRLMKVISSQREWYYTSTLVKLFCRGLQLGFGDCLKGGWTAKLYRTRRWGNIIWSLFLNFCFCLKTVEVVVSRGDSNRQPMWWYK